MKNYKLSQKDIKKLINSGYSNKNYKKQYCYNLFVYNAKNLVYFINNNTYLNSNAKMIIYHISEYSLSDYPCSNTNYNIVTNFLNDNFFKFKSPYFKTLLIYKGYIYKYNLIDVITEITKSNSKVNNKLCQVVHALSERIDTNHIHKAEFLYLAFVICNNIYHQPKEIVNLMWNFLDENFRSFDSYFTNNFLRSYLYNSRDKWINFLSKFYANEVIMDDNYKIFNQGKGIKIKKIIAKKIKLQSPLSNIYEPPSNNISFFCLNEFNFLSYENQKRFIDILFKKKHYDNLEYLLKKFNINDKTLSKYFKSFTKQKNLYNKINNYILYMKLTQQKGI